MSNDLVKQTPTTAPQLAESMRRLLADPFTLGSEIPKWEAPTVPPDSAQLRAARQELDRSLQPVSGKHMKWCINKLSVLPSKDGSTITAALYADNFIDVCGRYPDDLWSAGTLELLQSKTFRPSPAEMVEVVGKRFAERQRMLERVKLMLSGPAEKPAGPFVPEPLTTRLRSMRNSFRRVGNIAKAARYERELAGEIGREPHAWATEAQAEAPAARTEAASLPPIGPEVEARTLLAVAQRHRKGGLGPAYAATLEAKARELAPQLFVSPTEQRDVAEA